MIAVLAMGCGGGVGTTPAPAPSTDAPCGGAPVSGTPDLAAARVVSGLEQPLDLQAAPGDRSRLFVVEQAGRIRVVRDGSLLSTPFLDIRARVGSGGERGLLGLAFHPQYPASGRFFVNYTDLHGDTHLAEFRRGPGADTADASSEQTLLVVAQPFANHNGGGLAFGPDGKLYAGLGDGGSGGDPLGNGQNLGTYLGKMLRIDVDLQPPGAPADNPFVGRAGALPLIWAYGLRNPWRFAFDRASGDLVVADVGQDAFEEVDVGRAGRHGGENYGWNVMEGAHCYPPGASCPTEGLTLPVLEYGHGDGCSITGGVVYAGCRMPGYRGTYFYGDYCTGFVRSFRLQDGQVSDRRDWTSALGSGRAISSFGADADGEVYIVDHTGSVDRIVPR